MKRWLRGIGAAAGFAAACGAVLLHTGETAQAVREGLTLFVEGVLPSLFPMMFLAQWFVRSGGAAAAGELLRRPTRGLFGLPGACGAVVLVGMAGGYPSGAAAADALVKSGAVSREEGERLLHVAFCAGPGFTVSWVGAGLYHDKNVGLLILTVQALSCIIIGTAENLLFPLRRSRPSHARDAVRRDSGRETESGANAFVSSVAAAAGATLPMCGFVVMFRVVNALAAAIGVNEWCAQGLRSVGWDGWGVNWLSCLTEVTGGTADSMKLGLPFTAFVVGFGGLSVHFQNFAQSVHIRPRKARYVLVRLIQGLLCSALTALMLRLPYFSRMTVATAGALSVNGVPARFSDVSDSFGALLLVMCLMSVLCLPKQSGELRSEWRVQSGESRVESVLNESVEILRQNRPTVV